MNCRSLNGYNYTIGEIETFRSKFYRYRNKTVDINSMEMKILHLLRTSYKIRLCSSVLALIIHCSKRIGVYRVAFKIRLKSVIYTHKLQEKVSKNSRSKIKERLYEYLWKLEYIFLYISIFGHAFFLLVGIWFFQRRR